MEKITLDAYLFFDGNCAEAMEFYKGIFGGKLELHTFDQVPGSSEEMKGKVMHAKLMDGEVNLMASDTHSKELGTGKIELSLSGYDEQKLRGMFEGLSAGGNVKSPLKQESWGDIFGSLTDKYGVDWMFNIGHKEQ
jgi:PhnB protein